MDVHYRDTTITHRIGSEEGLEKREEKRVGEGRG